MDTQYKKLDIQTRKLASSLFLGNYKTAFQGRGMEFRDFQEYSYGDDAKDIDWLVSAREGKTLLRRYQEERQLEILFVFDMSPSLSFGSPKTVLELMQETFFLLAFSALANGDKIGAHFLGNTKETFIPFSTGQKTLYRIFQNFSIGEDKNKQLSLSPLVRNKTKKKLLFLFSDSFDFDIRELKILALQNDVIVFHLSDTFADTLEGNGIIYLSGNAKQYGISLDNQEKKNAYQILRVQKKKVLENSLRKIGVESVFLSTKSPIFHEVFRFMKQRENRLS